MGNLYFVISAYSPNNAPINRLLSFVEGFSLLGIEVDLVFVLSDSKGSRLAKTLPGVKVHYLWDQWDVKNRYLRQLSYEVLSRRFVNQLKAGDTVVLFDAQRILFRIVKKRGVKVFVERTEHPMAYPVRVVNMKRFGECCKRINGLFVISTALKTYYKEVGVNEEKIHIINMTVDPQRFENLSKQEVESPYIAYCGTASNNKDGVDELIKSFAIVAEKHPEYKLYIIGKGLTKDDESGNLQLVETLGLTDKVVFTGIIPSEDMPQMLKNATVLALDRPDNLQAQYGFPTKLGEYLLTENPVVITSVGDIPLFLKDGENALIAEPQNPEVFASKLIWAIDHSEESSTIGKKGAELAKKEFNAQIESQKMARIMGCV